MSARLQAPRGGTAELRPGYLRVRLTGDVDGVRLLATGLGGEDRVDERESPHAVDVSPTEGEVSLSVVPEAGVEFSPGTRLGLDVEVFAGAGARDLPAALDVLRIDVGALRSFELAACRGDRTSWHVGLGVPAPLAFDFSDDDIVARLDEREALWVAPGRYILRVSRGGEDLPATGRRWALILDSSASFSRALDANEVNGAARVLAGLLAEETGLGPAWTGATGLTEPVHGSTDPGSVALALDPGRPASWCLAAPALDQAWAAGAQSAVLLLDSEPADLPDVRKLLADSADRDVLLVLVGATAGHDIPLRGEVSGRLNVAYLKAREGVPAQEWDWSSVCSLLSGGRR
ncbi:hypothetical protein [Aeromicrobium duanguangcaii]|uniref:VWA domain-containing protein n=1 Tax=Aeromicrobium duanguangcaii TaxID=2968086 RepID=A0ABY5KIH7_9ACTN|nr:hypothetical protein [Aeromicrobium duanguangcaii]MCD9153121.1 hypothetical protein [Aeromicrobium duanguangcaii]UUI69778.1 hypothetical protein NP095_06705 [Aeromicrobium duanguangcaii]